MAETAAHPYATHLDIKFDPLTLIDVSSLAKTVTDQWYNQTLCKVNESVIRLGVMQGEYHWHKHDNDDEFFFVLSGRFIIDLEGHSIELLPNQGFTVPKGVLHCTRAAWPRSAKWWTGLTEITADCPKKQAHNMNDPCGARFPDLPRVL
jgi:hypothetical protein